jgi:hypothetical protein
MSNIHSHTCLHTQTHTHPPTYANPVHTYHAYIPTPTLAHLASFYSELPSNNKFFKYYEDTHLYKMLWMARPSSRDYARQQNKVLIYPWPPYVRSSFVDQCNSCSSTIIHNIHIVHVGASSNNERYKHEARVIREAQAIHK